MTATAALLVMAVALAVIAIFQVAFLLAAMKAMKQMTATIGDLRKDVAPLVARASRIAEDASKVSALAVIQAERFDEFMATTGRRLDDTISLVQDLLSGPVRQGATVLAAIKAGMTIVREWQGRPRPVREPDEDAMFVG